MQLFRVEHFCAGRWWHRLLCRLQRVRILRFRVSRGKRLAVTSYPFRGLHREPDESGAGQECAWNGFERIRGDGGEAFWREQY